MLMEVLPEGQFPLAGPHWWKFPLLGVPPWWRFALMEFHGFRLVRLEVLTHGSSSSDGGSH